MSRKIQMVVINDLNAYLYYGSKQAPRNSFYYQFFTLFYEGGQCSSLAHKLYWRDFLIDFLNFSALKVFSLTNFELTRYLMVKLLRDDMCLLTYTWRAIRGYPFNGQSTHTNAKSARKNKFLLNFRLEQFQEYFQKKTKFNFTNHVLGEYTNRLWSIIWRDEWIEARWFILSIRNPKTRRIALDLTRLAQNHTTGYQRVGAASKIGKKRQVKVTATLGFPVFFSRFIFTNKLREEFPFFISILTSEEKLRRTKKAKSKLIRKKPHLTKNKKKKMRRDRAITAAK